MTQSHPVYIVDYARTMIGKFGGALSAVRPDDLAATVLGALAARHPEAVSHADDIYFGNANGAGEENRNVARALRRAGLALSDVNVLEVNEAFAAQVLACQRELAFPLERLNVNGGAISLGHPIGATGARIVVTLLHEMQRRNARRGLATLCISGGLGLATAFER